MSKDKLLPASIIFLGISLIISAFIVSKSLERHGQLSSNGISSAINNISNIIKENNNEVTSDVLNVKEAANYLGISEEKLYQVINDSNSGIPYKMIGYDCIFSRNALIEWVESSKSVR